MVLHSKDLLGTKDLSASEITLILDTAASMKNLLKQDIKKLPQLQGKTVITMFYENSTRTRVSFELAAKYMSAQAVNFSASGSSVQKGETLQDTGITLDVMRTDVAVLRHPLSGAPKVLADCVKAHVVNAGDGINEHPTQALLDLYTMREHFGDLKGLNVSIIGDIKHSRVAKSNLYALKTMGANVTFFSPATLELPFAEQLGARVVRSKEDAIKNADVVMGLRIQLERQGVSLFPSLDEYHRFFGIGLDDWAKAKKGAILMHPGPVNRGVELSSAVADCEESKIHEQVLNGVAVRMAILYLLTRK